MTVTFKLQTKEDYDWLVHILKSFPSLQSTKVAIEVDDDSALMPTHERNQFLAYFVANPILVDKIEIPSRDERNNR